MKVSQKRFYFTNFTSAVVVAVKESEVWVSGNLYFCLNITKRKQIN